MKKSILTFVLSTIILLSLISCVKEQKEDIVELKRVEYSTLKERNGLMYESINPTPFTGIGYELRSDGNKLMEKTFRLGILEGKTTYYYPDNSKQFEVDFFQGKKHGENLEWNREGVLISKGGVKSKTSFSSKRTSCLQADSRACSFRTGSPAPLIQGQDWGNESILPSRFAADPSGLPSSKLAR